MNPIKYAAKLIGTQTDLAVLLGLPPQSVQNWVVGRQSVPVYRALEIEVITQGAVSLHDMRPDITARHKTLKDKVKCLPDDSESYKSYKKKWINNKSDNASPPRTAKMSPTR